MMEMGKPYDAEIEYLESDGNAYIDTDIIPSSTLLCEISFAINSEFSFGNTAFLFGAYIQNDSHPQTSYSVAVQSASRIRVPSGISFTNVTCATFGTNKHIISYRFGEIKYDDVTKSTVSGVVENTDYSIRLFGRFHNLDGSSVTGNFKLYGFTMTNNLDVVRDFIPVRVGNVGYMYDRVSKQIFGNAGTGDFILGPDK